MFLPSTRQEMEALGWPQLDVILVHGDAYIDSPFIGIALVGKLLLQQGWRVGVISQPIWDSEEDITRLGDPRLFWGVSGGSIDSMVANRTASGKKRKHDDYTPGGLNNRRPDRAVIVYSNLIRRFFPHTAPIVLGGIEASLRRIAHYDCWQDRVRGSILFDAKADYLLYGMAERAVSLLTQRLADGQPATDIAGLCAIAATAPLDAIHLPSHAESAADTDAFSRMFHLFYQHNDPIRGQRLVQQHGNRFLLHNPPAMPLSSQELDALHDLEFEREAHPIHQREGEVKALETIRFAISTHRGCYGECNFCAIAMHQGRMVQSRSQGSIIAEARRMSRHPRFKGRISDLGGPTANMYGFECDKKLRHGACNHRRCLFPRPCPHLGLTHQPLISLLQALRQVQGVQQAVVASGIRHDMVMADAQYGQAYVRQLVRHHLSGQMKIAPEHSEPEVLALMGKGDIASLLAFRQLFTRLAKEENRELFLTYYLLAAHPGCSLEHMRRLRRFCLDNLRILPRQAQLFTPTPCTWSTLMYWTKQNPFTGQALFVEQRFAGREQQKAQLDKEEHHDPARQRRKVSRV